MLTLRAKECRSGDVLDEEQVQAARKEDVLNALSQIASRFRTRVGESLSTVKSHDTPLAEATTPSRLIPVSPVPTRFRTNQADLASRLHFGVNRLTYVRK